MEPSPLLRLESAAIRTRGHSARPTPHRRFAELFEHCRASSHPPPKGRETSLPHPRSTRPEPRRHIYLRGRALLSFGSCPFPLAEVLGPPRRVRPIGVTSTAGPSRPIGMPHTI